MFKYIFEYLEHDLSFPVCLFYKEMLESYVIANVEMLSGKTYNLLK